MKTTIVAVAVIAGLFVAVIGQQFIPGLGWTALRSSDEGAGPVATASVAAIGTRSVAASGSGPTPSPAVPPGTTVSRPAAAATPAGSTVPAPLRVAQSAPAAPATQPAPAATARPAGPAAAPAPSAGAAAAPAQSPAGGFKGQFRGADRSHKGEGTAEIVKTATGWEARLVRFATTRGPDLEVWLVAHPDPKTQTDVTKAKYVSLGRLKSFTGDQSYALPAGVDPAEFKSLVIWCEDFSVLFASAPLAPQS